MTSWCDNCHRHVADYEDSGLCARCEAKDLRERVAKLEAELERKRELIRKMNHEIAELQRLSRQSPMQESLFGQEEE